MRNDDEDIVADGGRVRVPMQMVDSAAHLPPVLHRPGYVWLSETQRAHRVATYATHDQRKAEAWRNCAPVTKVNTSDRATAYDAHDAWLANAWRGAR